MKSLILIVLAVIMPLYLREAFAAKGDEMSAPSIILNSGYEMPVVGLGTYSLTGRTCTNVVAAALKNGYRLIDTAYIYGNEAEIGNAIRESGISREEIFITTKLYPNQYAKAEEAIDEALRKLDSGYIDLMLLHHPGKDDVAAYLAMEQAVKAGKIRSLGLSCYYIKELDDFLPKISIMPALIQNEIHPYYQDRDVTAYIQAKGIAVQSWYPLGGRGYTQALLQNKTIVGIAKAHRKTPAQIILRWDIQNGINVIPGSSNPAHMQENIDIFSFELSADEMAAINRLERHEKHDWY